MQHKDVISCIKKKRQCL